MLLYFLPFQKNPIQLCLIFIFIFAIFLQYENTQRVKLKKKGIKIQVKYNSSRWKQHAEDWSIFSSGTFS